MKIKLFYTIIIFFSLILNSQAQNFTIYKDSMMFQGVKRLVAYALPENYNKTVKYPLLIALHGQGDNAEEYATIMLNFFKIGKVFTNHIMLFPDSGEEQVNDFYRPLGNEVIIDSALTYLKKKFLIDDDRISIEGQSLGARAALKYLLDRPGKFKSAILHNPAYSTLYEVWNNPVFSLGNNYDKAKYTPISIALGEDDDPYFRPVRALADSLLVRKGKLFFCLVPDLKHRIPENEVTELMYKLTDTTIEYLDPNIYNVVVPPVILSDEVAPVCIIKNHGLTDISAMEIKYLIDDSIYYYSWQGKISCNSYENITLPKVKINDGFHKVKVYVTKSNGKDVAENKYTNYGRTIFNSQYKPIPVPYTENFSDYAKFKNDWPLIKSGYYKSWAQDTTAGSGDNSCMMMYYTRLSYYDVGYAENVYTKIFDLSSAKAPALSFDYSFNYGFYDYPYDSQKTLYSDTLSFYISTDGGNSFTKLFKKWGADLATYKKQFLQELKIDSILAPPQANEWKKMEINLKNYANSTKTMFRFEYSSGQCGIIRIDNFKVYDKNDYYVHDSTDAQINYFPNPIKSGQFLNIQLNNEISQEFAELYDCLGNKYNELTLQKNSDINYIVKIPNLSPGIYFIRIFQGSKTLRIPIVIE